MANFLDTGGLTYPGPINPLLNSNPYIAQFSNQGSIEINSYINSQSSVFNGTLSAHGNIVAMQTGTGWFNYVSDPAFGVDENGNAVSRIQPFLTGYLREYWRHPSGTLFGNDSAIPALTGVMPARFVDTPGNALYYIDLQMTRLTGSNFFNIYHFISAFTQMLGWLVTANEYVIATNNAQDKNLEYFGYKSYQELITQGYSNYQKGNCLRTALINVGTLVSEITNGQFGTVNSVAKHLINSGLGAIGDLTNKLTNSGVNIQDIYNPKYTLQITDILKSINVANDLKTIQGVLKSSIPNIKSAYDFANLEFSAGIPNDGVFQSLESFGKDIYNKIPNLNVETGRQLVESIDNVLSDNNSTLDNLQSENSLLPKEIIDYIKGNLPSSPTGGRVNLLNVIGCASGYLIEELTKVNQAIDQLNKTPYGKQIHTALENVTLTFNEYRQNYFLLSQENVDSSWPVTTPVIVQQYKISYDNAVVAYYNLLNQISTDPTTRTLVQQINSNWDRLCENISYEVRNFNKANLNITPFDDNSAIYSFISTINTYSNDSQNLGVDYFLYGLAQSNEAGDLVKAILNQFKNNNNLAQTGVNINGLV